MKVNFEQDQNLNEQLVILKAKEKNAQVNEWITYIEKKPKVISGKIAGKNKLIPLQQVSRFYTSQKKVYAVCGENEWLIASRLYELETQVTENFVRISNTEIINLDDVKEFELTRNGLILITFQTGAMTSSSRRYLKKIKERLGC
ncbi:LytTR family DNA-binding domain-containing protein [Enterococcus sp. LJL99]